MVEEPHVCKKCGHNMFLDVKIGTINKIRKTTREGEELDFRWVSHDSAVICAKCLQVTRIRAHLHTLPHVHLESLDPARLRRTRWGKG